MYKNIIFDLGGVVVDFNPREFLLERFYNEEIEHKVFDLTFGSEEWTLLDAGQLSRAEGNARMLEKARAEGCAFEVQSVLDDWARMLKTRRKTVEVIKRLKKMGFSIYYLSNIPQDVIDEIRQRDFWPLFDGGIASCEVKLTKPDPAIYRRLFEKFDIRPEESFFIDDIQENIDGAKACGMDGYCFADGDVEKLREELGI